MLSSWKRALPSLAARAYVGAVVIAGIAAIVALFPTELPRPALVVALLLLSCVTSIWKVNLPIPLASSSTLSVSYAANLMSLLLLGTPQATIIAVVGVWTQCTINIKRPYPLYRTAFSAAGEAITMFATGFVYQHLGGHSGLFELAALPRPIVGAILTYFVVNTGLVAGAIAVTTGRSVLEVWRTDFLWSASSFFVAGTAGAIGAILIDRGQVWAAVLMVAPVYLTYSTYRTFVGRLEDQRRHRERVAAALEEMTELEHQRNELLGREQAARASAEEANRLKDQFLAIVSHELRTPLNAILGWSDILQRGRLDKPKKERAVRAIYDSARVQARLIDELLDVSRIISGKLRLERTIVDWNEVVAAALDTARPAAESKNLDIDVHLDPAAGAFVGDAERLQQVVWNLVTNAVKFTPQGGRITIRLQRTRDAVELSVADTGEGIPPHFLVSMFEPFRQADGSNTRRHGGLGLGLSIARHLVEAHGGTISAESAGVGQGSTFVIRLPMADASVNLGAPDIAAIRAPNRGQEPAVSLEGARILVVDDDDAGRDVVAAHLEARSAKVIGAASAGEALAILERERVDVMLVDIAMPGRDGYELIRTIRGMSPAPCATIPAAALTAFARAEDRRKSLESGFQMHLTKPVEPGTLVEAIANLTAGTLGTLGTSGTTKIAT